MKKTYKAVLTIFIIANFLSACVPPNSISVATQLATNLPLMTATFSQTLKNTESPVTLPTVNPTATKTAIIPTVTPTPTKTAIAPTITPTKEPEYVVGLPEMYQDCAANKISFIETNRDMARFVEFESKIALYEEGSVTVAKKWWESDTGNQLYRESDSLLVRFPPKSKTEKAVICAMMEMPSKERVYIFGFPIPIKGKIEILNFAWSEKSQSAYFIMNKLIDLFIRRLTLDAIYPMFTNDGSYSWEFQVYGRNPMSKKDLDRFNYVYKSKIDASAALTLHQRALYGHFYEIWSKYIKDEQSLTDEEIQILKNTPIVLKAIYVDALNTLDTNPLH